MRPGSRLKLRTEAHVDVTGCDVAMRVTFFLWLLAFPAEC